MSWTWTRPPNHTAIECMEHSCATERDPFPGTGLLEHAIDTKCLDLKLENEKTLQNAKDNGLPRQFYVKIEEVVRENEERFLPRTLSGTNIPPLNIVLTQDSSPVEVKLCNYSEKQWKFLKSFLDVVAGKGRAYPSPASRRAFTLLMVPKTGKGPFSITVNLRRMHIFNASSMYSSTRGTDLQGSHATRNCTYIMRNGSYRFLRTAKRIKRSSLRMERIHAREFYMEVQILLPISNHLSRPSSHTVHVLVLLYDILLHAIQWKNCLVLWHLCYSCARNTTSHLMH